jgi:tetratricopeptide (TPR) repeat protein
MLNAIAVKISRYTAAVFPFSPFARAFAGLGLIACTACVNVAARPDGSEAPLIFYTVTAEIALLRHEPRVAALQYAAAAENSTDPAVLRRATEVTAEALQPSLTLSVASRWIDREPDSIEAHRAAAWAALDLFKIDQATAHYRVVLESSPRGTDAEFARLDTELAMTDDVHAARQLADRLALYFPPSPALLKLQAHTALRADDPAAAVRSFNALAALGAADDPDFTQGLWRARILSGDVTQPLAEAASRVEREPSTANRLDLALLLLAANQNTAARAQLVILTEDPAAAPTALHLLGLIDFQEGDLAEAASRFAQLVVTGKFLDDAIYYLALIAERHQDLERALRLYAQVQEGDNAVPALLRAAAILRAHGAAPAAEELLDRLVEEAPARAPEILAARARIYADAGEPPQAQALLDQAMRQYPDSVQLQYAAASLQEERGNVAVALRDLHAVARRRPADPAALNAYGYTLADHNQDLVRAHALIERAYAAAPKNAAILDSFGWVLFRQGRGEDALDYLNAAYADDRSGDIAAHLGEVLWRLGRRTDADRVWSEAGRADADNALLKATLARLHASQ